MLAKKIAFGFSPKTRSMWIKEFVDKNFLGCYVRDDEIFFKKNRSRLFDFTLEEIQYGGSVKVQPGWRQCANPAGGGGSV